MHTARWPLKHGGAAQAPKTVVVHAMAEFIHLADRDYYAVEWLHLSGLSVHAFVTPSGVVIRSREDTQIAYHAAPHNDGSLGVEFLVPGVHSYGSFLKAIRQPYLTDAQYAAGVELVKGWAETYVIETLVRHSDLAPGRKFDPGEGFPWESFVMGVST